MTREEYEQMSEDEKLRYWAENHQCLTEQDITPGDEALIKLFGPDSKREKKELPTYPEMDVEATEPEMCLFSISKIYSETASYFDTKEEMEEYAEMEGLDTARFYMIEYLRSFAGRSDVLKETDANGAVLYFRAADDEGYGIYNRERSNREQKFIWEFSEGSIADMYAAFRERGIVFEDDVYGKMEEEKKKFLELCQKDNLMNSGGQSGN